MSPVTACLLSGVSAGLATQGWMTLRLRAYRAVSGVVTGRPLRGLVRPGRPGARVGGEGSMRTHVGPPNNAVNQVGASRPPG